MRGPSVGSQHLEVRSRHHVDALECAATQVASDTPGSTIQHAGGGGQADRWIPQRSAFIGRDDEQHHLTSAFDAAESGYGTLVLLVGEPGIGKTALCDQVA